MNVPSLEAQLAEITNARRVIDRFLRARLLESDSSIADVGESLLIYEATLRADLDRPTLATLAVAI